MILRWKNRIRQHTFVAHCNHCWLASLLVGSLLALTLPTSAAYSSFPLQGGGNKETVSQRSIKSHARNIQLDLPPEQRYALGSVTLDGDVYRNSRLDFADLRILNEEGEEVPFVLRRQTSQKMKAVRSKVKVKDPKVKPLESGELELLFTPDSELKWEEINGLTLNTNQRNFELKVSIQVRPLGIDEWQELGDGQLFDYTQYMDVRNTDIEFPVGQSVATEFRVLLSQQSLVKDSSWRELTRQFKDGQEVSLQEKMQTNRTAFKIESIQIWKDSEVVESSTASLVEYPITVSDVQEDAESQTTIVNLHAEYQPLVEFSLNTSSENFSRAIELEASNRATLSDGGYKAGSYETLANTKLTKINLGNFQRQELDIKFPEARRADFRVKVVNHDSAPLTDWSFTAHGAVYELLFIAEPDNQYRLVYGNDKVGPATYDTTAIEVALHTAELENQPGVLGSPEPYQWKTAPEAVVPWWQNQWLFGGIVGVLVLVLGATLWSAAKRLDGIPKS